MLRGSRQYEVVALLTTVTGDYDRISMHGVRRSLLEKQSAAVGLPVTAVTVAADGGMADYETKMEQALGELKNQGINGVAFGDIFLADLRKYREEKLAGVGMAGIFPLWCRQTLELANSFIDAGFESVVSCVDLKVLDHNLCGRLFDRKFLAGLPPETDPYGENREFHSFCFAGPIFKQKISFTQGAIELRGEFCFRDIIPLQ